MIQQPSPKPVKKKCKSTFVEKKDNLASYRVSFMVTGSLSVHIISLNPSERYKATPSTYIQHRGPSNEHQDINIGILYNAMRYLFGA